MCIQSLPGGVVGEKEGVVSARIGKGSAWPAWGCAMRLSRGVTIIGRPYYPYALSSPVVGLGAAFFLFISRMLIGPEKIVAVLIWTPVGPRHYNQAT